MRIEKRVAASLAALMFMQGAAASSPPPDAAIDRTTRPVTIPFVLRDNLVVISATINGKPHPAILDSGAGGIIIDRQFAGDQGLKEGPSAGEAAGAGDQARQLRPVDIADLAVGPLRFDHLAAYSMDLDQLSSSAGFPIGMLIGSPAFRNGAVTVDYRRRRVTFGPSGSGSRCAAPIPLTILHDVPVVEVELRATPTSRPVRLKLIVDLGTRHRAMVVGGPFLRSETGMALLQSGQRQQVGHGIGGAVQGSVARISEMRIGSLVVNNLEVALSSGAPAFEAGTVDGTLGVPLWKDGVISFDYPARSLCIER